MEFIPLERYGKKITKKAQKSESKKRQNLKENENKVSNTRKIKGLRKPQINVVEKQNFKNKFTGTSVAKKKKLIPRRLQLKIKNEEDEENAVLDEGENPDERDGEEENEVDDNESEENEEENDKEDHEDIDETFKKKCKELDEKKKNRLFVKLKKKIYSEAQIKELHPDIRSVIFPRKKRSRWCWVVFASEEQADRAKKKLIKNKDIFVNKPNPYEKVMLKRKEKIKTILLQKEAKKKLEKIWM